MCLDYFSYDLKTQTNIFLNKTLIYLGFIKSSNIFYH